jgi:hypothetical protein
VLERPDRDVPGPDNVRPGLHLLDVPAELPCPVVWWDPSALTFGVQPMLAIRGQHLIEEPSPDMLDADRRSYQAWPRAREVAREAGLRRPHRDRVSPAGRR